MKEWIQAVQCAEICIKCGGKVKEYQRYYCGDCDMFEDFVLDVEQYKSLEWFINKFNWERNNRGN